MDKSKWVLVGGLIFLAVLSVCIILGCNLGDVIRVETPNEIQKQTGLPKTISLNTAEQEYRIWLSVVKEAGNQWKANIERSAEIRAAFSQLAIDYFQLVGPQISGIPVLAPAIPALTALFGLWIGVAGKSKGKQDSYNKGLEVGYDYGINGKPLPTSNTETA